MENIKSIHYLFVLDLSGSMNNKDGDKKTRWEKVVDALNTFVNELSEF